MLGQALFRHAKDISSKANIARATCHFFRMAIDRVFSLKGVGLIVTGMVFSGLIHTSQTLTLSSTGSQVRIRGIRVNGQTTACAKAGERCALNITGRGIGKHSVRRGNWLMHQSLYRPTKRIDVDLEVLKSEAGVSETLDANTFTYWLGSSASTGCSFVRGWHCGGQTWFRSIGAGSRHFRLSRRSFCDKGINLHNAPLQVGASLIPFRLSAAVQSQDE